MALTDKLDAIGNAIREKTGDTEKYTLDEMPQKIEGITEGPTDSELVFQGSLEDWVSNGLWTWFIEKYDDKIKTQNITNLTRVLSYGKFQKKKLSFDFNCDSSTNIPLDYAFQSSGLRKLPYIYNCHPKTIFRMFQSNNLEQIPDDYFDTWNWGAFSSKSNGQVFSGNYTLFSLPPFEKWMCYFPAPGGIYSNYLYGAFEYCYCLQELNNIPINQVTSAWEKDYFSYTFLQCYSLKHLTFQPGIKQMKSQVIDLTDVGYCGGKSIAEAILNYKPLYLTENTIVTDDASYQRLKNEKYWIATDMAYSRYNHDSAVETINSLPDTSAYLATAGGTNTIKFTGAAGEKTDGGAINTLTADEIAIATAKGWTVTFV